MHEVEVEVDECPICYEPFSLAWSDENAAADDRRPRALVCGHAICTQCLSQHLEWPSTCPICRQPLGGASVAVATSIIQLAAKLRETRDVLHHVQGERLTLTDSQGRIVSSVDMCAQHPDERRKLWCARCNVTICNDCLLHGLHRGHAASLITQAVKIAHSELTQWRRACSTHTAAPSFTDTAVVRDKAAVTRRAVDALCDTLVQSVQTRRHEVHAHIDSVIEAIDAHERHEVEYQSRRDQLLASVDRLLESKEQGVTFLQQASVATWRANLALVEATHAPAATLQASLDMPDASRIVANVQQQLASVTLVDDRPYKPSACPNLTNTYHTCSAYCREQLLKKQAERASC